MKGEEVFEKLKRTDIFNTSLANEEKKRQIFLEVWSSCFTRFRRDYGRDGLERDSDGGGFGYLVEEFARQSSRIQHNTPKGEHIADLLLGFLRNGDEFGMTGLRRRLHNPDFLQVEITGRRVLVTGIVEVKATAEALRGKLDSQIANQESNLRRLASAIENKKHVGSAHSFFQKRKIVVAEKLTKIITVPMGEGDKVRTFLPDGWECVEIEFSYEELVFIAQSIWPGFTVRGIKQFSFSEGYIAKFEREFLTPLFEFAEGRLKSVLYDSALSKIPAREMLIAIACLGKIPLLNNDINWVAAYLNRREFYGLFPVHTEPPKRLTKKEEQLSDKLTKWYLDRRPEQKKDAAREHVLFFLSNLDFFSRVLNDALKNDEESLTRVGKMDSYDLLSFLG